MTLTRTLPTQNPAGLPLADERRIYAGMLVRNADGTPRHGILPAHTGALVTGRAEMAYDVAPFVAATSRSNPGAEFVANDAVTRVVTTPAPASNSRIDVIWVRSQFALFSDASNDPVLGVTQGVAAPIPTKPSIPAGAEELGTAVILSTATQTSTAAITPTHAFTAMAGGCVFLRNQTEQDAFTPQAGTIAWRIDTQQRLVYMPNATTPGWFHIGGKPADGGAVTISAGSAGFAAGTPAPLLKIQNGRYYLEGTFVNSVGATFGAGSTYVVGSIPASSAPLVERRVPISTNGPMAVSLIIATTGVLSLVTHQAFTGTASFVLDGASWADKKL
ncbi:hypothetical protein RS84_00259 [Microbacterium hydrocarbonoxydans]|uniref:Uncharacterized protein n=1 Tax=Microbacterium hydrocarbonoxydans TaxID=273678 RepID=A0A0M2HQW1_9MICO|nr:hypothetical protein [Microbacterium hydrocarbonoxydans]KJL49147.1 hypothetical protein RS84_00259 [Microbacterium hydrocarbonoxydans]